MTKQLLDDALHHLAAADEEIESARVKINAAIAALEPPPPTVVEATDGDQEVRFHG